LINQGHDVHVYQTSGNIAVTDDEALKFAEVASDFVGEVTAEINFASVIEFLIKQKIKLIPFKFESLRIN
jgi:glucosamine-6-phosphate deaminase